MLPGTPPAGLLGCRSEGLIRVVGTVVGTMLLPLAFFSCRSLQGNRFPHTVAGPELRPGVCLFPRIP